MLRLPIAASALCAAIPVMADGITMDGAARSVSLFVAIAKTCSQHLPVNAVTANKAGQTYLDAGQKVWGREFVTVVRTEAERRAKEVVATGELAWCQMQRDRLRHLDLSSGIFD